MLEFSLCGSKKEGLTENSGGIKVLGAGVLSSYGEMEGAMSAKTAKKELQPQFAALLGYNDMQYQQSFFFSDSFTDIKKKIR